MTSNLASNKILLEKLFRHLFLFGSLFANYEFTVLVHIRRKVNEAWILLYRTVHKARVIVDPTYTSHVILKQKSCFVVLQMFLFYFYYKFIESCILLTTL